MAQKFVDYLSRNYFTCPVCMEHLKDPKMLPCAHTFCLGCLERYQRSRPVFSCPTCRRVINLSAAGVRGLPQNFTVANLMEFTKKSTSSPLICHFCKGENQVKFCIECKMNFCLACMLLHDKMPGNDDHTSLLVHHITDKKYMTAFMAKQVPRCDIHKQEKIRFYCVTCNRLICEAGKMSIHYRHMTITPEERLELVKEKFETLLNMGTTKVQSLRGIQAKLNASTATDITHIASEKQRVQEHFQNATNRLMADRDKLLSDLKSKWKSQLEPIREMSSKASDWLIRMEKVQRLTRRVLTENNQWVLLKMETALTDFYSKLKNDEESLRIGTTGPMPRANSFSFSPETLPENLMGKISETGNNALGGNNLEWETDRDAVPGEGGKKSKKGSAKGKQKSRLSCPSSSGSQPTTFSDSNALEDTGYPTPVSGQANSSALVPLLTTPGPPGSREPTSGSPTSESCPTVSSPPPTVPDPDTSNSLPSGSEPPTTIFGGSSRTSPPSPCFGPSASQPSTSGARRDSGAPGSRLVLARGRPSLSRHSLARGIAGKRKHMDSPSAPSNAGKSLCKFPSRPSSVPSMFSPASPSYSPSSPEIHPNNGTTGPYIMEYSPASPDYSPTSPSPMSSPEYSPTSPFLPISPLNLSPMSPPNYFPESPAYSPTPMNHFSPQSPTQRPSTPSFSPMSLSHSPTRPTSPSL